MTVENSLEPIHVLVVDDEKNIRDGSERTLNSIGFYVFKASNGNEALETLTQNKIAIVLLDLKMPGMEPDPESGEKIQSKVEYDLLLNLNKK